MAYTFTSFTKAFTKQADTLDELLDQIRPDGVKLKLEEPDAGSTYTYRVRVGREVYGWIKETA